MIYDKKMLLELLKIKETSLKNRLYNFRKLGLIDTNDMSRGRNSKLLVNEKVRYLLELYYRPEKYGFKHTTKSIAKEINEKYKIVVWNSWKHRKSGSLKANIDYVKGRNNAVYFNEEGKEFLIFEIAGIIEINDKKPTEKINLELIKREFKIQDNLTDNFKQLLSA